ncbi:MAG: phage holin family protein [Gallionella sp.]|nr:phage holin family protein [Gallionella sp.]
MAESTGLMESLKRMAGTLLVIFQTRLALLSNEIEEERLHVGQMLLYGSVALLFFGFAIILLTVFILMLFWDSQRLLVLGGFTALYFVAGLLAWNALRRMARERSKLFSASLAELAGDRDWLAPRP